MSMGTPSSVSGVLATVLSAVHVNVSSLLGPHQTKPCHMFCKWLEAGDRGLGTRLHQWTAHYITVTVWEVLYVYASSHFNPRVFICCHRNWWKGVWLRRSLIWCLMQMPLYSWMLSGDSWLGREEARGREEVGKMGSGAGRKGRQEERSRNDPKNWAV